MRDKYLNSEVKRLDAWALAYFYGNGVKQDREKGKQYLKQVVGFGHEQIKFDNYGDLLAFLGIIHFNDDEFSEAQNYYVAALEFYQNYLPKKEGQFYIKDYNILERIDECISEN